MIGTLVNSFLPRTHAATNQTLGHPAAGVIGWFDPNGSTASAVPVTRDTALTFAAVWCANRIISETLATLPCIQYRRTGEDSRERATDDPRYYLVHDQPHPEIDPVTFFEVETSHVVMTGNSYARIVRDQQGTPMRFEPRMPEKVRVEVEGESLSYELIDPKETIQSKNMLHVKGLGGDGVKGWSVVTYGAQAIGAGLAGQRRMTQQFQNSSVPSGLLKIPMRLDKDGREAYRREWEEVHKTAGKIGILHGGMEFTATPLMSNHDSQFLELNVLSIRDVARLFRVPLHMLADLENASVRANIEQQGIEFIVYSMAPWIVRWQQCLNRKLLSREERSTLYFEFLIDALLRGDQKSRYEAHAISRQWGWKSVNEIRREENMNAVEGGEVYLQPSNMVPAGTVPETITNELQSNLAKSLEAIVDSSKGIVAAVQSGNVSIQEAIQKAGADTAELIRVIRADRDDIRRDIQNLGTVQVQGWTELRRERLATCLKHERSEVAQAAKRQEQRGEPFLKWLDKFYDTHKTKMTERVGELAGPWCQESYLQLLAATDGDAKTFVARIQEILDGWESRL